MKLARDLLSIARNHEAAVRGLIELKSDGAKWDLEQVIQAEDRRFVLRILDLIALAEGSRTGRFSSSQVPRESGILPTEKKS